MRSGALDIALWDICGKAAGKPTWELLGSAARETFRPYASLLPSVANWEDLHRSLVEQVVWAKGLGFQAAKLELLISGPYAHQGLDERDELMVETIRAVREAAGPEFAIMVDVGYAWDDADRALAVIETWADLRRVLRRDAALDRRPRRLPAPLRSARPSGSPPANGRPRASSSSTSWIAEASRSCSRTWAAWGASPRRAALRRWRPSAVSRACRMAGRPGITIAATAQLAAITPHMPFFEFVPQRGRGEPLAPRADARRAGAGARRHARAPRRPGLGVELDREALERFAEAGRRRAA